MSRYDIIEEFNVETFANKKSKPELKSRDLINLVEVNDFLGEKLDDLYSERLDEAIELFLSLDNIQKVLEILIEFGITEIHTNVLLNKLKEI